MGNRKGCPYTGLPDLDIHCNLYVENVEMTKLLTWKPDWQACRDNLVRWWNREGMGLYMEVLRDQPRAGIPSVDLPADLEYRWTNAEYRCSAAEAQMARVDFWAEAFPYFDTQIGPGSLGTFIGSRPGFAVDTVWYEPYITDPDQVQGISLTADRHWLDAHLGLIDEGMRRAGGRYLVGIPDLIENMDTLAALRGDANLLYDLVDRPDWIPARLEEINRIYFEIFDLMAARVSPDGDGNAFSAFHIWGPGKTAKIQCDISATLSPRMFRRFVQPYLRAQCEFLDFSLYHLDGTNAMQHVEPLLEIEPLNAIEWTPQAGRPGGGDPCWFDLYKRIRAGGKGVQAVGVQPEQVIPLVDAVGPHGVFILLADPVDQVTAEKLMRDLEPYRT